MSNTGFVSFLIIMANVLVSYRGMASDSFFNRYNLEVDKVLVNRDYKRLLTSGFLHVSWIHLIFNMLSFYFFSSLVELTLGPVYLLVIYFASLVAGNLFAIFVHRNHSGYSAAGASGAICGIMFASIALYPGLGIGFILLPVYIPSWIYGLGFVLFSIYGIRSKKDNIGHEAHLAGGVAGMLLAIAIQPGSISQNYLPILAMLIPAVLFIYFIITRPHLLLVDNHFFRTEQKFYSIEHRYNARKRDQQLQVDRILDKIHRRGIGSLTRNEKEILDEYSKTVR